MAYTMSIVTVDGEAALRVNDGDAIVDLRTWDDCYAMGARIDQDDLVDMLMTAGYERETAELVAADAAEDLGGQLAHELRHAALVAG